MATNINEYSHKNSHKMWYLSTLLSMNKPSNSFPLLISLEALIGAGKSTFLEYLKIHFKNQAEICFLDEPINEWNTIQDEEKTPMLVKFYENPKKYGFSFQVLVFLTRYIRLRDALANPNYKVIITERCLESDFYIFAKMSYEYMKNMEKVEYEIYLKMVKEIEITVANQLFVYINVSSSVCMKRIKLRNREGEEKLTMEYLNMLDHYHRMWLYNQRSNVMVLEARSRLFSVIIIYLLLSFQIGDIHQ